MKLDKRHLNTLISICIFILLCFMISIIKWESDFMGIGIVFITEGFSIFSGIIAIVIRFLIVKIEQTNLIYNYIGTLNLIISLCIVLVINTKFVFLIILNLIIGLFIIADIYRKIRRKE